MIWIVSRSFLTERVKCQVLKPPVIQQQESETSRPSYTSYSEETRSGFNHLFYFPKKALLSPEPWNLCRAPQVPGAQLGDCLCLPPYIEAQIQEQLLTIKLIILCQQRLRGCSQVLCAAARLALVLCRPPPLAQYRVSVSVKDSKMAIKQFTDPFLLCPHSWSDHHFFNNHSPSSQVLTCS